jgi:hypothetical protein
MPNPRKRIEYQGVLAEYVSYQIDAATITYDATKPNGSAQVGLAVMMSGQKTVALTSEGAAVVGKLILVESDGTCNVQVEGYADLPGGNGATLTPGAKIVGALGAANARGFIRAFAAATLADVAAGRGEIVDASTPARTVVKL